MLNYDEIVTRSEAHRDLLLTKAAQQRLGQALATSHAYQAKAGARRIARTADKCARFCGSC